MEYPGSVACCWPAHAGSVAAHTPACRSDTELLIKYLNPALTYIASMSADYIVGEAEHVDILDYSQQRLFRVTRVLGSRFRNLYVVVDCVLRVLGVALC